MREEILAGRALVISVVADDPGGLGNLIVPEVARRFEIEEGSLSILPLGHARFLLILPDENSASRIYNGGRPLFIPPGRLHLMRWSRFLGSSAALFPHDVEVELKGVPAHAWDEETAAHLLRDHCIPRGTHPETAIQRDVFRIAALCSDPCNLPPVVDLVIPEPPVAGVVGDQARHTLTYPIHISVRVCGDGQDGPSAPPPPPPASGNRSTPTLETANYLLFLYSGG